MEYAYRGHQQFSNVGGTGMFTCDITLLLWRSDGMHLRFSRNIKAADKIRGWAACKD